MRTELELTIELVKNCLDELDNFFDHEGLGRKHKTYGFVRRFMTTSYYAGFRKFELGTKNYYIAYDGKKFFVRWATSFQVFGTVYMSHNKAYRLLDLLNTTKNQD